MFVSKPYVNGDLVANFQQLLTEMHDFASHADEVISIFANCANHLKNYFQDTINWVGFYLLKNDYLVLGPFNGLPAVTKIGYGQGVCGTSWRQLATVVIDDVCAEPNHITCDLNSQSEICLPVLVAGNLVAVLDIDAPTKAFFGVYRKHLEEYVTNMSALLARQTTVYFGGGCFWGVEKFFTLTKGVLATEVGYANSNIPNPTYEQICNGASTGSEVVKVTFDNALTNVKDLLAKLFAVIDPFTRNRQGNDVGIQYRTGLYSNADVDLQAAQEFVTDFQKRQSRRVHFEVQKLMNYYPAEAYHQDYLVKNPRGYCHIKFD